MNTLTPAFDLLPRLQRDLSKRRLAVFLDYDGTISPIVSRPELGTLPGDTRHVIDRLAQRHPTAIVSGRPKWQLQDFVKLDNVYYSGSHGMEIAGPAGSGIEKTIAAQYLPDLRRAYQALAQAVRPIPGVFPEDAKYTVAVHFRLADPQREPEIERIVDNILLQIPSLRKLHGKKIFVLRPDIDWHKGSAVAWLVNAMGLDSIGLPIYIGDDVTDEDAFKAVADQGVGILVAETPRPTAASHLLRDTNEVKAFLEKLTALHLSQ
ncbi:MAG: trehalose-phosphatase [SAR202 cluster bacterium]|nr:trehalose-phosphatase [SAR202 cluster bacterium]